MAKEEIVTKVHGRNHTYTVVKKNTFSGGYLIYDEKGKCVSSDSSRARAVEKAFDKAGPGAYSE